LTISANISASCAESIPWASGVEVGQPSVGQRDCVSDDWSVTLDPLLVQASSIKPTSKSALKNLECTI
jgi:hypothetical protein